MAKDKPKNTPGRTKGGTKSSRWSERTRQNKIRASLSRAHRLEMAAERRRKGATVTIPLNRMVETGEKNERGEAILVPHKQRGKKVKSALTRDTPQEQGRKSVKKAEQRRNFSGLSHTEKAEHREAGRRQFANA